MKKRVLRSRWTQERPEKIPGLSYLLLIILTATMAGGAFNCAQFILLLPAGLIALLLLSGMASRKLFLYRRRVVSKVP